jgi:hypothetical protein
MCWRTLLAIPPDARKDERGRHVRRGLALTEERVILYVFAHPDED